MIPAKIPSLFAEFKAIKYLNSEGFTSIQIYRKGRSNELIFCAKKNGCKFAIEVTNAGYEASLGYWRHDDIVELLLNKLLAKEKYKQLVEPAKPEGCGKMALILVIDTEDKVALNTCEDYLNILKESWEQFGSIADLHLCIYTGRAAFGYGNDDTVYPSWEKEAAFQTRKCFRLAI